MKIDYIFFKYNKNEYLKIIKGFKISSSFIGWNVGGFVISFC